LLHHSCATACAAQLHHLDPELMLYRPLLYGQEELEEKNANSWFFSSNNRADATYSNREWTEHTGNAYTLSELNALERRFLAQLEYRLFVDGTMYTNFVTYLEVSLALKELFRRPAMSYKDILILSQYLLPVYAERLGITLRPWEAMLLMSKVVAGICAAYCAVLVMVGVAALATYEARDMVLHALRTLQVRVIPNEPKFHYYLPSPSYPYVNTGSMNCFVSLPDHYGYAPVFCE